MRHTPSIRTANQQHYSASLSRLMLTTALVGVISISGTQAYAAEPIFIESENSVKFDNDETITAIEPDQSAIEIVSGQDATASNSGNLSSTDSMGMWIFANGEADVFNNGLIDAHSEVFNVGGLGSANVVNEGSLSSNSAGKEGIVVGSLGDINLENSGAISADQGIFAFSTAGVPGEELSGTNATTSNGGAVNIENSGNITLRNFGTIETISSQGIIFSHSSVGILGVATNGLTLSNSFDTEVYTTPLNTSPVGLNVTISNTGDISDSNSGSNSIGIAAGAVGDIEITSSGIINTGVTGIFAVAGGDIDVTNDGDVNLSGFSHDGAISLQTVTPRAGDDAGNITLTNNGDIDAPNIEDGIDVESLGTANVTNSGEITARFSGIDVETKGDASLLNSGNIIVSEFGNGTGIELISDTAGTLVNSGTINASDQGINAGGFGTSDVTNTKDGVIVSKQVGIDSGGGNSSTISNAGKIEAGQIGIKSSVYGGTATFSNDDLNGTFNFPGGEVNIVNSGSIKMVQPEFYEDERYELDGHTLYTPNNVGILALSLNGGARVDVKYGENGQPLDERFDVTPAADDAANNAVSVTNSGTIDGTGSDQSNGIYAMASDGVDINNTGDIMVANGAIYVIGNSPVTVSNSGMIRVTGEFGPHAVNANSGHYTLGDIGQAVSVDNSGTVDLTDAGNYRRAIRAWSNGGTASITNSGSVITTADGARGLHASSGNDGYCSYNQSGNCIQTPVVAGNTVTINSSGSVSTAGNEARAIHGFSYGGAVNINTAGTVTTTGRDSRAISASSGSTGGNDRMIVAGAGGTVTVNNTAVVKTSGEYSRGIQAYSNGGFVDVINEGKITTTGISSRGIDARSGNDWIADGHKPKSGGSVSLINKINGNISTGGDYANAMQAASTTGNVTVDNAAKVSTTGEYSIGVFGYSGSNRDKDTQVPFVGGNVSVTNSGTVETKGDESNGMEGWSNGGTVTVENSGTISTFGSDAEGVAAYSGTNRTIDDRVVQLGSDVKLTNSGSVSTSGNSAVGVEGYSYGGAVQLDLAASSVVSTSGDDGSHGASAYSGSSRTDGERVPGDGGNVIANLRGKISTSGAESDAVSVGSYGGNVSLTNNATITASGAKSHGLEVGSGSIGGTDRVARDGDVVTVTNNTNVAVSGADSNAIHSYSPSGKIVINNAGILSATNGSSIVASKATSTTITNSGTLKNGAVLDTGADTLTNTGTLAGDFDFGGGKDTLNLNAGSTHSSAKFDGGAGTDIANFNDPGKLTGSFKNFETAKLASGSWTVSGSWGAFNTLNTSKGSQLTLNSGILGAGQVNLVAGSTLKGSGTISGGLTNDGSILLASSDTLKVTGNLHSNAGSTIEFSMGGANGTSHSKIEVTGGKFTFDNSEVLNISVNANTSLEEDSRYKIAIADGGVDDLSTSNDLTAVAIADDSAAFSFERIIQDNALWVEARATISEAVASIAPELAKQADVVEEFVVESGAGGALAEQLNGLNEQELVTAVKELTAPNEAAGAQSLSTTVSTANNIVNTRISSRISGGRRGFNIGGRTSRSSYNAEAGQTEASQVVMAYGTEGITGSRWLDDNGYTQAWIQAFWGFSGIGDADSDQYGTSVGIDFRPNDSILIGGSFSYSRTDSDAPNSSLEADSYGGMLYGAKGFDSGLSLSGVVGYFHSQNDTRRLAFGSNYFGDYDTNTFTVSGKVAQEIEMESWLFTPSAGVRYAHASFDSYTETGGPAPLTISRDNLSSVELSAQASFSRNFDVSATQEGLFEIHVGALYEAADSDSTVSYRFSPTGSVLTSQAGVPRLKFNVGTLIDVPLTDQISAEFAYEGTFASDYADHLLRAKFKMKF